MSLFVTVLLFSGVLLSLLCSSILFFKNRTDRKANRFLAIAFLFTGCLILRYYLIYTKEMLFVPLYYQFLSPFFYLIAPCIYLYVLMLLSNSGKKPRYYLWHFLPVILMLLDVLPWFNLSPAQRYAYVVMVVRDSVRMFRVSAGLFPNWLHNLFRLTQGLIYVIFQIRLILKVYRSEYYLPKVLSYMRIFRWSVLLTFIMALMYLCLIIFISLCIIFQADTEFMGHMVYLPACVICTSFLLLSLYLYFNPHLLYEIPLEADTVIILQDEITAETLINAPQLSEQFAAKSLYTYTVLIEYQKCLERELSINEVFKRKGLTVTQLANLCEIPVRALAYLFTNIYFKGFNDFINEYRLQYMVERMNLTDWRLLTVEGLAMEAGFSSRTTFFLAFKKKYGMNPTAYLNNMNKSTGD